MLFQRMHATYSLLGHLSGLWCQLLPCPKYPNAVNPKRMILVWEQLQQIECLQEVVNRGNVVEHKPLTQEIYNHQSPFGFVRECLWAIASMFISVAGNMADMSLACSVESSTGSISGERLSVRSSMSSGSFCKSRMFRLTNAISSSRSSKSPSLIISISVIRLPGPSGFGYFSDVINERNLILMGTPSSRRL